MIRLFLFLSVFFVLLQYGHSQVTTLKLGPDNIGINQVFTISVTVKNERLKSYNNFPEINGFVKRGISSSSNTNITNGQISTSQSITMSYVPQREGTFLIPPFTMEVNGKEISSPGKNVKVGPPVSRKQYSNQFSLDPFKDLFGRRNQPLEFLNIKEDAFLALTIDKDEVYLGEGFTATLAFYVSESNRAPLQFYDLGRQVSEIVKDLKPVNCWEENFKIENISGELVKVEGREYTQYKIYQVTFYPLNLEPVVFPETGLELIKYKVAKNPTFFGQNRKEEYKMFHSKPKTVTVKELPSHPLKDLVSIGIFRLEESIDKRNIETGQSFNYKFRIFGEGNISSIDMIPVSGHTNFEFYEPNMEQKINRRNNKVTGSKTFSYFGIPNEPGVYYLGNYFSWIYFNTVKEEYDTLVSTISLRVTGESRKNERILSNDLGSFYDRIEFEDNALQKRNRSRFVNIFANSIILIMLAGLGFIAFRK